MDEPNTKPQLSLSVIIVGAGIAGLTTAIGLRQQGHNVTVLERHSSCQGLGGPIRLGPNATRVLISYGLEDVLSAQNVDAPELVWRRWEDGRVLLHTGVQDMRGTYGAPLWSMARYTAQFTLCEYAKSMGVKFVWGVMVDEVDLDQMTLYYGDSSMAGDIIIGADGISSKVRRKILGPVASKSPLTTYNVDVPIARIEANPETAHFAKQGGLWLGPNALVAQGPMQDPHNVVNLAIAVENDNGNGQEGEWLTPGDIGAALRRLAPWNKQLLDMINMVPGDNCYLWKLAELDALEKWSAGHAVLVGDAAHAMLPYTGQGASQCVEDSGCLVECLSRIKLKAEILEAFKYYEQIRRPRAEWISRRGSLVQLPLYHLADGPAQEERDEKWRNMKSGLATKQEWTQEMLAEPPFSVEKPVHPLLFPYTWGYDIFYHTKRYLDNRPL